MIPADDARGHAPGKWYVKFVNMVRAAEPGLDYESNWATLTFAVR